MTTIRVESDKKIQNINGFHPCELEHNSDWVPFYVHRWVFVSCGWFETNLSIGDVDVAGLLTGDQARDEVHVNWLQLLIKKEVMKSIVFQFDKM